MAPRRRPAGVALLWTILPLIAVAAVAGVCHGDAAAKSAHFQERTAGPAPLTALPSSSGRDFFASPDGTIEGDGSQERPWRLEEALTQIAVQPGDTVWLRGGTYRHEGQSYWSTLAGTAESPIVVRSFPGERATIDGSSTGGAATLVIQGAYTWYWGFEVMSSATARTSTQSGPAPSDVPYGEGILIEQTASHPGVKFINLIVHDTRQGISWWQQAEESEIYGCLIYNNGWIGADHPHGHGIYAQNVDGLKTLRDSLLFRNFSHNLHAYTEEGRIDNFYIRGNGFFEAGLSEDVRRDFLVGGSVPANNIVVRENAVHNTNDVGSDFRLGYGGPAVSPVVLDNYLPAVGVSAFLAGTPTVSGNTLSRVDGSDLGPFPQNTWLDAQPSKPQVLVRPNLYEPGRAFVYVFNWGHAATVPVDLSGVLSSGAQYEIHNAFDVFAPPVAAGVYGGGSVSVPTLGLSNAAPIGITAVPPLDGVIQAFLVLTPGIPRQSPRPVVHPPRQPRSLP